MTPVQSDNKGKTFPAPPTEQEVHDFVSAAGCGNQGVVSTFLKKYLHAINARDKSGYTALIHATENNRLSVVSLLLEAGADVNEKGDVGNTALMQAAMFDRIEVAELLLAKGARMDERNDAGWTASMVAAHWKSNKVGALLDKLSKQQGVAEELAALPQSLSDVRLKKLKSLRPPKINLQ